MKLKINRKDDRGLNLTTDNNFGLVIICQDTTLVDHQSILNELTNRIGTTSKMDIFYQWSTSSVFIFDINEFDKSMKESINDALSKVTHMILFNNEKRGGAVNKLYVKLDKNKCTVGKQFYTLLTYKKE